MDADLSHGGALAGMRRAFPDAPQPWFDLSTGINPWPYPHADIPASAFATLPDAAVEHDAREAMAAAWGCAAETIALTPGSQAAIQLLPQLFPASRVGVVSPTYNEHARIWRSAGARVEEIEAAAINADDFDCVVLCNPNNPDGRQWRPDALLKLAGGLAAHGGRLIVDEAFADLSPNLSVAGYAGAGSIIALRSFGKFFGLAGVRLGALVAAPAIIADARRRLGPWAVSGLALELARRAYRDRVWIDETLSLLKREARELDNVLRDGGLAPRGGTDLFRWVACDDAHGLWRELGRRGIYVRRFPWSVDHLRFGLPAFARDRERLAAALRDIRA